MSYRIKVESKKTLSDEGELLNGMERAVATIREYQLHIIIGFLVLVTAAVAVGILVWLDRRHAEHAAALEVQATRFYLDRPADLPAKADENLRLAITLYHQVLDQYPHSAIAPLAQYHLGNALVQANDFDGAVSAYQKFAAMYGEHSSLLSLVYQRLGYAYLLKGNLDQASKALSAVLSMADALNKDQVLFELGKIEENQARPEGALAHYQELIKTYPNSPFTGEAAVRTKALEVKKNPDAATAGPSDSSVPSPKGQSGGVGPGR